MPTDQRRKITIELKPYAEPPPTQCYLCDAPDVYEWERREGRIAICWKCVSRYRQRIGAGLWGGNGLGSRVSIDDVLDLDDVATLANALITDAKAMRGARP